MKSNTHYLNRVSRFFKDQLELKSVQSYAEEGFTKYPLHSDSPTGTSSVLVHDPSIGDASIRQRIVSNISDHINNTVWNGIDLENITLLFYKWLPGSSIPWHTDSYEFGLSIYLNSKRWELNWGGLFLFWNEDKKRIEGYLPEENSAVFIKNVMHTVSTIHLDCRVPRYSIQIFGNKK